jgi:hypothetical protein
MENFLYLQEGITKNRRLIAVNNNKLTDMNLNT